MELYEQIIANVQKILKDRDIKQATAAYWLDVDPSQFSKILKGRVVMSIRQMEKLATGMELRAIDLITYPDVYRPVEQVEQGPAEVLLQLRLTKEKKDQVLKLVFGENNIEILNK